jgi:UDP-GlcNAc:undecaprenyl-phosphate GlcNAc-1-phosphate transferase
MSSSTVMLAAIKAVIIALILTPIFRDIFRAYNVVDRPGRRKVHAYPIPRVGGIPIMTACLFALLQLPEPAAAHVRMLLPGVAAIFVVGLVDDFFNLKPKLKLAGQMGAALLIYANGMGIARLGTVELPEWVSLPLTVFWLLLATNALNLIDGLDGLCGGVAFVAAGAMGVAGILQDNAALPPIAFTLAAALLGFLFYNLNPATVFLGDSGALTAGFLLGCLGLIWNERSATLAGSAVPLLALAIPLLDVLISIVRRYLKGHPVFGADRGHTHHRLLDRGCSVRQATGVLYAVALTGALFAVLLAWQPLAAGYHGAVLGGFCLVCMVGIRGLRYPEFEAAKTLLSGEFRKAVAASARLGHLEETLNRASDLTDWWNGVTRSAQEEGFGRITWLNGVDDVPEDELPDGNRQSDRQLSPDRTSWMFEVTLEGGGIIEVRGATAGTDLIRYASVLRNSFARVRARARIAAIQ